jgi:hypothetical protein
MSTPRPGAYLPWTPARRPGARPGTAPKYRVLVHRRRIDRWKSLPERVGLESAQQFWDHVAMTPGTAPRVNKASYLRGRKGKPITDGFSRTIHYEISGPGRIDYQYHDTWKTRPDGDPHRIVVILEIDLSSH